MSNQCFINKQTSRQIFTSINEWHGLMGEDIRRMEEECMDKLKEMIESSEILHTYVAGI